MSSHSESSVITLIETDPVKIIPAILKRDGMLLKPGMDFDSHQGVITGTTEHINHKYIKEHPCLEGDNLKNIMVTEAECYLSDYN